MPMPSNIPGAAVPRTKKKSEATKLCGNTPRCIHKSSVLALVGLVVDLDGFVAEAPRT